ncbi:unnamed protein product [Prunus armeniaca]
MLFPVIDSIDLELLEKDVDMAEIKRSLFGIGGLKTLGVDGFPACFYQAQWNNCADDIFALVTLFRSADTLITLVPKVQSPQSMVQFRPISLCSTLYKSGPAISHLFFYDDLVLFAEASANQAKIMKSCLDLFCSASGQIVHFEKFAIFCSPNTCNEVAKEISLICVSPFTNDLGKYLGMPLLHSRIGKRTYSSLVDKVRNRLAAWKSKLLSLARRATLIQAVTDSIPVYAMQTTKLPVSVCNDLDRLNRNFFWGSNEKKYKIHLCQWDLACRPKGKGGLVFKKTASMNQALLAKIGWRLHSKDNGLWAKIYEAKYLKGASICDNSLGSKAGRGDSVKFWEDNWVIDVPLRQQAGVLTIHDSNCFVSSFSKNGWWDIDKLRGVLCEDLIQQVISVPMGFLGSLPDTQIWKGSANGNFYLTSDPSCGFCSWPTKTVLHILRDCERARSTWNAILPAYAHHFFHLDAQPWMKVNVLSREKWNGDVPWSTVFVFTCWHLWSWRNKHVFQNEDTVLFSPRQVICGVTQEWINSTSNRTVKVNKVQIHVAWEPPGPGQFKLNVDGSRRSVTGYISAGGVIRDPFGGWVSGFAINLGKGQVLEAEIWGLSLQVPRCALQHVFLEKNIVADRLANWSYQVDLGLCVFEQAPSWLSDYLVDDLLGIVHSRLVCLDQVV